MGDGGNAFGGAVLKLYELGQQLDGPLEHVYLGPRYSTEEVKCILNQYSEKIVWTALSEYGIKTVASDLADTVQLLAYSLVVWNMARALLEREASLHVQQKKV